MGPVPVMLGGFINVSTTGSHAILALGVLHNENGTVFTDDNDKASCLNDYFCSAGTCDNGQLPDFARVAPLGANLSYIIFTTDNIAKVLRCLKPNSSCGSDGFPPILLKKLAPQLSYPLSVLFNNSNAVVTPIAKNGIASDADNYHPISLIHQTAPWYD